MGASQRAKGRRTQTEGTRLLEGAGWNVVGTSAGVGVEDACCIDPNGRLWAVEVTSSQTVALATKWQQTLKQATERKALPMLLWRFDGLPEQWRWWVIVDPSALSLIGGPSRPSARDWSIFSPVAGHPKTLVRVLRGLQPHAFPWIVLETGTPTQPVMVPAAGWIADL